MRKKKGGKQNENSRIKWDAICQEKTEPDKSESIASPSRPKRVIFELKYIFICTLYLNNSNISVFSLNKTNQKCWRLETIREPEIKKTQFVQVKGAPQNGSDSGSCENVGIWGWGGAGLYKPDEIISTMKIKYARI